MATMAQPPLTQTLHETNQRLRYWLEGLAASPDGIAVATPQQMNGLLSELLRAGTWLREGIPEDKDAALETALAEYRKTIERIRDVLPLVQGELLRERARLEAERSRIESVAQWAQGSRQTL
jgi:hypothetical protein